jgi:hypothetical protein
VTVNAAGEVHPALALIAERLAAGGGPGAHGDGHRLALAIEGGGMRGTIPEDRRDGQRRRSAPGRLRGRPRRSLQGIRRAADGSKLRRISKPNAQ